MKNQDAVAACHISRNVGLRLLAPLRTPKMGGRERGLYTLFNALTAAVSLLAIQAQEPISVVGLTEPIYDITMSSPVIGIVGARRVEEGIFVKKGEILIELDKSLEELDVNRKSLLKELAKTELDRIKSLAERNAISVSREEMDKKQSEFSVAAVELDLAKEQLRKRVLASPIDGFVTEIYLEVGEACEARQPLIRLVDTRRCYFIAHVEPKVGHSLKPGQKMKLEIPTGAAPVAAEGTITVISPVIDPASGLMRIKLTLENTDGKVRPGVAARMFVNTPPNVK
jgi:RND family efflux transporter MFP subunit